MLPSISIIFLFLVTTAVIFLSRGISSSSSSPIPFANRRYIRILENHPLPPREASDSHRVFGNNHHNNNQNFNNYNNNNNFGAAGDTQNQNEEEGGMKYSFKSMERLKRKKQLPSSSSQNQHFPVTTTTTFSSAMNQIGGGKHFYGNHYLNNHNNNNQETSPNPHLIEQFLSKNVISDKSTSEIVILPPAQPHLLTANALSASGTGFDATTTTTTSSNNNNNNLQQHLYNSYTGGGGGSASLSNACDQDEALRVEFHHDKLGDGKLYGNIWGSGFIAVEEHDYFEYEMMWLTETCNCGVEIEIGNEWRLRDHATLDHSGFSAHSERNANMSSVVFKKWYKRRWFIGNMSGKYVEKYVFSAFQNPGSKGSALFRNIQVVQQVQGNEEVFTVKKIIWSGGQFPPPTIQNTFFKGSFVTSCQSPIFVSVGRKHTTWKNLPLRRGEISRLNFEIELIDATTKTAAPVATANWKLPTVERKNDKHHDENEMDSVQLQDCFEIDSELFPLESCCELLETSCHENNNNNNRQEDEKDQQQQYEPLKKCLPFPSSPSSSSVLSNAIALNYFRTLSSRRSQQQVSISNQQIPNPEATTNVVSTQFFENWKKQYSSERFDLKEISGVVLLNWTARLRHSTHFDVTLWELRGGGGDEENEKEIKISTSANFSESLVCKADKNVNKINCLLNAIIKNRRIELQILQDQKQQAIDRAGFLQNLSPEEKQKYPNSAKEWGEQLDRVQLLKKKLEEVEIEWDQRFLVSLLQSATSLSSENDIFPLRDSLDFEIPNDASAMKFLKSNILPSAGDNNNSEKFMTSKESELEISISFLKLHIYVTIPKAVGQRANNNQDDQINQHGETLTDIFEDIHVKELRVMTTKLFGCDF